MRLDTRHTSATYPFILSLNGDGWNGDSAELEPRSSQPLEQEYCSHSGPHAARLWRIAASKKNFSFRRETKLDLAMLVLPL